MTCNKGLMKSVPHMGCSELQLVEGSQLVKGGEVPGDATLRPPTTTSRPIHAAELSLSAALPIFPGPSGLGLGHLEGSAHLRACGGGEDHGIRVLVPKVVPSLRGFPQSHHLPLITPAARAGAPQTEGIPPIFSLTLFRESQPCPCPGPQGPPFPPFSDTF